MIKNKSLTKLVAMPTADLADYLHNIQEECVNRIIKPYNEILKDCYIAIKKNKWKEGISLSFEALGELVGLSKSQINNVMNGRSCNKITLIMVCLALGLRPIDSLSIIQSAGFCFNTHEPKDAVFEHTLYEYYGEPYRMIWRYLTRLGVINKKQYAPSDM